MIKLHKETTLTYPTNTLVEPTDPGFQTRVIYPHRMRDLLTDPLSIDEYLYRPCLARGRWLLLAKDIRLNKWRQFYLANSIEFATESVLRIGIYDPDQQEKPVETRPTSFGPTKHDRVLLAHTLIKYKEIEKGGVNVGVFSET